MVEILYGIQLPLHLLPIDHHYPSNHQPMEPMSSHPMYIHQLDKMMQMYYKLDEKQLLLELLLLEFEQQVELLHDVCAAAGVAAGVCAAA